jgi:peptidoglycan/LPS O-acetylase OafA/YrhL
MARVEVPQTRGHVPALDGVRGVAILVVVFYHLSLWAHVVAPVEALWRWTMMGHVGVDLFFVLSGYLITGILWDSRESSTYLPTFFARRALRIFPLYYLVVFGFAVLAHLAAPNSPKLREISANQLWLWTYTSNVAVALKNAWPFNALNHLWSLAVEEQFYLVWPFIVWRLSREKLFVFCFIMTAAAMLSRWILIAVVPGHDLGTYSLTICRMDALLLGGALALEARRPGGGAANGPWAVITRWIALPAAAVALIFSYGVIQIATPGASETPLIDVFVPTCWAVAFAGFISASLIESQLSRLLRRPTVRFFGRYSYGLYVFHYPLHPLFEKLVPIRSFRSVALGTFLFFLVGLSISTLVALVSYHVFEMRFLALKKRFDATMKRSRTTEERGEAAIP